jgi:hypothetical protein
VLIVVYAIIGITFVALLMKLAATWRRDDLAELAETPEQGVPYGPRAR